MAVVPKQKPGNSKQNYATPDSFVLAVAKLLGIKSFSHDFAADASNTKAETFWDEQFDSLKQDALNWGIACSDGWGWLNPPFAQIGPWAKRCAETKDEGGQIAFLVPAGVGANWYRDYVHNKAYVVALNGRLAFMPDKPTWLYPKDCILCFYSPDWTPGFDVWTWKR